ncbi:MFS transporter [Paenibacillus hamazuiensis]|uniref:MFS transporter n=1 Tax=Paenibacillus hamazuiensis TaxID=2936508 RepID=UPI00200F4A56|nr:MFS transporter [Paenibacillus hamazuiensis]
MTTVPLLRTSLLNNRVVQMILASALFLQIGVWVRNFAVLLYVTEQTNADPLAVSLIAVAEYLPIFLLSFIGGTFADRWPPKRTMVCSDLLSAVSVFAVLFAMSFGGWKAVFAATLISSALSQFSQPAGLKLFKQHVPSHLVQTGMSLYQTLFAVFTILGPVFGTFVYQQYGIAVSIGFVGIAFLLSAVCLLLLPPDRHTEAAPAGRILQEMRAGFRYIADKPSLKTLGWCFVLAGLGLGIIQPLAIFLVTERLGLPKEYLQWLMAASGTAMLAGSAFVTAVSRKLPAERVLSLGMAVCSAGILLSGLSTNLILTLVSQVVFGLSVPAIHIGIHTIVLKNADESLVGRVNGFLTPLYMAAHLFSMGAAGWIKGYVPISAMYVAASVFFLIAFYISGFGRR